MSDSLLIRDATILTMDPQLGDLERGNVLVIDGRIEAVGADLTVPDSAEMIDGRGQIVIPGLVDTHRHMFQGILRGIAPHATLADYMQRVCGELSPRLTAREVFVGELLSARGALLSGVTTVQDISNVHATPERSEAVVAALRESGLRAVMAWGKANGDPSVEPGTALPTQAVARVRADLLADDDALVTMALLAEGGDDSTERHNAGLARELGLRTARHSVGPDRLAELHRQGLLRAGTTVIHGTGLDHDQLSAMADAGATLSVAPAVEMMMDHGYPLISAAATHSDLVVSLSVDVEVTCPADMFSPMRSAYETVRRAELVDRRPHTLTVREVLRLATLGGARALGLDGRIGSITPGKDADLVMLRVDRPDVAPVHDPVSTVVLQCDRAHVDTVLVAGRVQMRHGRTWFDDTSLVREANASVTRLVHL